jgi:5-amino-6-(5-phosphoribosylamino)uracil reductase
MDRPHVTVVLAMSADGKIADYARSPARFGSSADKAHLETQVAQADAMLFGAGTLRAYGTTLRVTNPDLLQQRHAQGRSPQPIQIVCSASGELDRTLPFFTQPVPRWLLTTPAGAKRWQAGAEFERILWAEGGDRAIDCPDVLDQLAHLGIRRLVVGGGGALVSTFLQANLVDDLWLTVCPLLLGGEAAPSPVEGAGWLAKDAPRLHLLSVEAIAQEVVLHYRVLDR